jgi:membrane associated rhomboid family serine protease
VCIQNGVIIRHSRSNSGYFRLRALVLLAGLLVLLNPNADSLRLFMRAQKNTSTLGQLHGAVLDLTKSIQSWMGTYTTDEVDWHRSYHVFSIGASGKHIYVGALGVWFDMQMDTTLGAWGGFENEVQMIAVINVLVFFLWQCLPTRFMRDHFTVSRRNLQACRIHCILTSTFSQESITHLLHNLMSLLSVGPEVRRLIPQHFLLLYLGGGCFGATLSSLMHKHNESLGASGAVFALLAFNAFLHPTREYILAGFQLTAVQLMWALLAIDFVRSANGDAVDYVAHAGGAMFGAGFCAHLKHAGGVLAALSLWINSRRQSSS